jgi:predicted house-cleaning noncanonical NTP pyrophosphatase (MazG superfamily)
MPFQRPPIAIASWSKPNDDIAPNEVGGKAAGLFLLPEDWVPPFFVVGPSSTYESLLDRLLAIAAEEPRSSGIIVRSNAVSEARSDVRGTYVSLMAAADRDAVHAAILRVLEQSTQPGDEMLAIVQVALRRDAQGHLSNERHVAERRTQWVLDEETAKPTAVAQQISARDVGEATLQATTRAELLEALGSVAFRLSTEKERVHCEWVWDGARAWIVQRDTAVELRGGPVHRYLSSRPLTHGSVDAPITATIKRLNAEQTSVWSKLRRPTTLKDLGMPTAPVWHLAGTDYLADEPEGFPRVRSDLEKLLELGPIVVRCDVSADRGLPDLSLDTSDPLENAEALIGFMRETVGERFHDLDPAHWAFLPAPLVGARASIMAQARPGSQRVRLHTLWGFPDGVGLLGHDKWSYDMATEVAEERRAHKANCCLYVPGQGWSFEPLPVPHDWAHTINEIEARTASSWARRLADHLNREVQLMVLARIDGRRGPEGMLPWHYTDHNVPPPSRHVAVVPSGLLEVATPADLQAADLDNCRGLLLRPSARFHRDRDFLTDVGRRAADFDVPLYFEGSVLGHPYYLIKSAGATVVPIGSNEPEGVRIEYNKLVRDGVPEVVRSSGGSARTVKASPQEADWLLRQKLIEEAFEVSGAAGEQIVEELADLLETFDALIAHTGIDRDAVEQARRDKRLLRGGFDELIYLEATSSDSPVEADQLEVPSLFGAETDGGQMPAPHDAQSAVRIEESNARRVVLRVPVVPPLRKGIPLREYGLEIGQGTVKFTHEGADLEITIESTQPTRGPGQLSLAVDPA